MPDYKVGVTFVGDDKQLNRAIGRVENRLQKFGRNTDSLVTGKGFSGLFSGRSLGAFAGGAAAYKVLGDSIDVASNLNEQITKNTVVFGESSAAIMKWADTTASSFGIAKDQALEFTGVFGNMLRPLGIAEGEASKMSTALVQLAADMASFNNASVEDTLLAIRSGLAGEAEPLRRYGVLLSEARVQQEAMAATGKKSASQLTQQEKTMARYRLILKDTALAQGDFARTTDGYANQQRKLQANLRDLEATLGQAVVPVLGSATGAANDLLTSLNELADKQFKIDILATLHIGKGGSVNLGKYGTWAKEATGWPMILRGVEALQNPPWGRVPDEVGAPGGTGLTGAPGAPTGGAGAHPSAAAARRQTGDGLSKLQRLQLAAIRAARNNYLSDDIKVAQAIADLYKQGLAGKRGKALNDARTKYENALSDVWRLQQQLADRQAADAEKQKRMIDKASKAADKASKTMADALKKKAEGFKDAILSAFDRKQDNLDTARALEDAKAALKQARVLGGPEAIKLAMRDVQDAQLERQRYLVEGANVTANRGGGYTININGLTLENVQNVKQLLAELRRVAGAGAKSTTGLGAGYHALR